MTLLWSSHLSLSMYGLYDSARGSLLTYVE